MTKDLLQLIADFKTAADQIDASLAPAGCAIVAAQNWIVVDDFGPLRFDVQPENGRHRATCIGHGHAHKVNRFTRDDAQRLAEACDARAVYWADAARSEVTQLRQHIALLETELAA